eukprot:74084-Pyramimonas_sp.AAC.1
MLLDHRANGQPGSWISRALWLCLAPLYFPLLRPVLIVRAVDSRPYDVLCRWMTRAEMHTPEDV